MTRGWGKDGGSIISDAFFCCLGLVFLAWVLATTLFVGNVLALFSVLFIWPINRAWHDGFLDEMAGVGWGSIVDYIEHVGRLSPVITGELEALGAPDHPFHKGNKIVLSNHATAGDPLALFVVGHRLRRIGSMRFMVKKVLLLFPILGLAAYFLNFVFLSRTWTKDEGAIRKVFRSMIEGARKRSKIFWICLFPEGTRLTPAKLQKSQEYAASKNLPHLKHLLIPRIKGLQATLVGLRQDVDAVLDLTIAYSVRQGQMPVQGGEGGGEVAAAAGAGGTVSGHLANHFKIRPSMGDLILRRSAACSWPVHIHVRILPVSQIPEDEVCSRVCVCVCECVCVWNNVCVCVCVCV
jgi:1-acyl-sn-glycerol-3-phosphate acyltransferase